MPKMIIVGPACGGGPQDWAKNMKKWTFWIAGAQAAHYRVLHERDKVHEENEAFFITLLRVYDDVRHR